MSTTTWERSRYQKISWPVVFPFLLLLIGLAVVQVKSHAVIRHGEDAISIRACLDKNGEYQVWKSISDPNKFFRICEIEPGKFGFQIVQCVRGGVCEKTAFTKGEGKWPELVKYLKKIAEQFDGDLPW